MRMCSKCVAERVSAYEILTVLALPGTSCSVWNCTHEEKRTLQRSVAPFCHHTVAVAAGIKATKVRGLFSGFDCRDLHSEPARSRLYFQLRSSNLHNPREMSAAALGDPHENHDDDQDDDEVFVVGGTGSGDGIWVDGTGSDDGMRSLCAPWSRFDFMLHEPLDIFGVW